MARFLRYNESKWWWWTLYLILASRISGKSAIGRQHEFDDLVDSIKSEDMPVAPPPKRRRKARVVENVKE